MAQKRTKKNTAADANLEDEFSGLNLGIGGDPFGEVNETYEKEKDSKRSGKDVGGKRVKESKLTEEENEDEPEKEPSKGKGSRSSGRKSKPTLSLEELISYTKEMAGEGFFKGQKLTTLSVPVSILQLTSRVASIRDVNHYHLVSAILHKVMMENVEEIEQMLIEDAKAKQNLFK